jgi:hypothetical protein
VSNSDGKELSSRQLKVIALLLSAKRQEDALEAARITRQTLSRWTKNQTFRDELRRRRDLLIDEAFDKLRGKMTEAADVIVKLLASDNEWLKRLAANDIITHVLKVKEMQEMEERLASIERILKIRE